MNILRPFILAFAALALPVASHAADTSLEPAADEEVSLVPILDAKDVDLDEFLWVARPLIIFANAPADPLFIQQMQYLMRELDELAERDIVVITDTDPAAQTDVRTKLRPRSFMLALIGKDGQIKFRKPLPWSVRELSRSIDKMPIRQQEIRDRRASGS
ncbi:DUF4174 domain-containing protein [Marivita sp. XM-24bin2]|jgi:hypothetical protein|uniref:DUF4174 domain-containing protein n=1 Tax=unclassified Marivita TaxID=2632480 RepID=UPI000D78F92A|nr:DUF4174 domain-containing protein [Marivita sp. XM-24bin2]MCR9107521.1 DUF4174 domain-containing protein [Paracoccaceae bacterium]PWL35110.1 MAG: hypothetical protein DCO97_10885 [Marivita sp. XM-24bin2]